MKNIYTLFTLLFFSAYLQAQNWNTLNGIPEGIHHPVTFALGNFGYSLTGTNTFGNDTKKMYRYNPITDTWATMSDFPGSSRSFSIGLSYGGYGYMGFGVSGNQYLRDLWRFDPSTNQWTRLADCPGLARRHPAFMAANNKIYVGLGNDNRGDLKDFWVYDIATDTWTQLPDIPGDARHHPFMFGVEGEVFAGMGHGGPIIYDDWYRFDTVLNNWVAMNDFPGEARVAGTQFSHAGRGYVLSGDGDNHSFMATGEFWEYQYQNDSWTQLSPHPGRSRWAPGSFVIADTLYFFGGVNRANNTFPTDMFSYQLNSTLDKEEYTAFEWSVYPNPTKNGILYLESEEPIEVARILSLNGQELQRIEGNLSRLDISQLPVGLYLLEVKTVDGLSSRKKIRLLD